MIETRSMACNHIYPNDKVKLTSLTISLPPFHKHCVSFLSISYWPQLHQSGGHQCWPIIYYYLLYHILKIILCVSVWSQILSFGNLLRQAKQAMCPLAKWLTAAAYLSCVELKLLARKAEIPSLLSPYGAKVDYKDSSTLHSYYLDSEAHTLCPGLLSIILVLKQGGIF